MATLRSGAAASKALLACGIAAALIYVGTDLFAAARYPGYSLSDQAVSELFAIGAPTAPLVVPLFSLSSLLLAAFGLGVWKSAGANRALRLTGLLFVLSAADALVLWTVFPMHMRGAAKSLTDAMHLVLSSNPFVLLSLAAACFAFRGRLRWYSLATILMVLAPAVFAFRFAPALAANEPTPGLGAAERAGQYIYQVWQTALAFVLVRRLPQASPFRHDRVA